MRIAVYGAGAIGGLMAVRLAAAGSDVVCIDRDTQLEALERNGVTLLSTDGVSQNVRVKTAASLADTATPDVVILAVKANDISAVAPAIAAHAPKALVVTVQNGIPWWYFAGLAGPHENLTLESVDPGGATAKLIPPSRVVGCIAYPAAESVEPGVIRHMEGERFPLGELDGANTPRPFRLSSPRPASRRRFWTTCAARSGSRHGEISHSTRSAR